MPNAAACSRGGHFSVDGTLIQAWASHKSFVRKDGHDQDGDDFKGKPRSNGAHASRTDDDARLYCKGNTGSELRYMGHTLSDNRHGLIASAVVIIADGHAEREAAKAMINDAVHLCHGLLEAPSLGATVVVSDTAPVKEAIQHGDNGYPVDFFSPNRRPTKVSHASMSHHVS